MDNSLGKLKEAQVFTKSKLKSGEDQTTNKFAFPSSGLQCYALRLNKWGSLICKENKLKK